MASGIGEATMALKEIEDIAKLIDDEGKSIENILNMVKKTVTDLLWQSAGFMVEVLNSAINFFVNAFTKLFQNLKSLGDAVLRAIKEHTQADKDGANALKGVINH